MNEWTLETVIVCDQCNKPMFPNLSTWDEEGCAWICTTSHCRDWTGSELEAEDLIAVGVEPWIADRIEALANAILDLEE